MLKDFIQKNVALIVDGTQKEAETVAALNPAAIWNVGEKWTAETGLALAVIAVASERRAAVASDMCRRKMDFALLELPSVEAAEVSRLALNVKKTHLHTAVLGSFRYPWPVCALRELTVAGCLGAGLEAAWQVPDPQADQWKIQDAMEWLGIASAVIRIEKGAECALALTAANGTAQLSFNQGGWGKITVASESIRKKIDREEIKLPPLLAELSVIQNTRLEKQGWTGLASLQVMKHVNG